MTVTVIMMARATAETMVKMVMIATVVGVMGDTMDGTTGFVRAARLPVQEGRRQQTRSTTTGVAALT